MSSTTPSPEERRAATEAARQQARAVTDRMQSRDKKTRIVVVAVVFALIVALVAVISVMFKGEQEKNSVAPANVSAEYTIPIPGGEGAGKAVPVVVYQDYNCPGCAGFHANYDEKMAELVEDNTIDLSYHNVSILDNAAAGRDGSIRAAQAAVCVVNEDPEAFSEFNSALFQDQRPNHEGMSNAELTGYADRVGVDISSCLDSEVYKPWALKAHSAGSAKIESTPSVTVNGEMVEDLNKLEDVIESAHEELNS